MAASIVSRFEDEPMTATDPQQAPMMKICPSHGGHFNDFSDFERLGVYILTSSVVVSPSMVSEPHASVPHLQDRGVGEV